jgi:hypothetical protein
MYSFTLLDPGADLMLFLVGYRRGYSMIFWKHGKFARRHASIEDVVNSLDTILEDPMKLQCPRRAGRLDPLPSQMRESLNCLRLRLLL